jgi:hypothetical protein
MHSLCSFYSHSAFLLLRNKPAFAFGSYASLRNLSGAERDMNQQTGATAIHRAAVG